MPEPLSRLRQEADRILSGGKGARAAWTDLVRWAAGKGPAAMKIAITGFMERHARSPDAAPLIPELMHGASSMPSKEERKDLVEMIHRERQAPLAPRLHAGSDALRPIHAFQPSEGYKFGSSGRMLPVSDPAQMRDAHIKMRDSHLPSLGRFRLPQAPESARFDSTKNPGTFPVMSASKGHHIVRSLVERMRSHGREAHEMRPPSPAPAVPRAKKRAASAKKSPKLARKPARAQKRAPLKKTKKTRSGPKKRARRR
ncbi:MAG: hypothetical protein AB1324_08220 [Candidatus Micrarchaeota archaeon]